uniref:Adenine nucleotide translocase lysine methyltransferase n=1 Tax=Podarcis muralis TaxID=64176 RepID=A0A670JZU1_PODMU
MWYKAASHVPNIHAFCKTHQLLSFLIQVPYVPSSVKQVRNMMSLLQGRSGKLVDLGSGDGRIVLEAYKQGFRPTVGYELNPWLLQLSNFRAWRAGCYGKVFFRREDLWKVSSSHTEARSLSQQVPLLERKLLSELPDGACVVAARFPFLNWTPTSIAGDSLETAWAYNITAVRQAGSGARPVECPPIRCQGNKQLSDF